ncbi:MAG: deacylase [Woeseiaceae bacterium]|nr:deacylase [Woeseiaceae bacterium]NIP20767.1 deacylase [Woeseiaceae bacterium]NIS89560.1 deacylase [Woeseiaceae bacterium]
MPSQQLKSFLDSNHVKYKTITHSPQYTAQEIAASAHIPGKHLAKTVIVKVDGEFAMAVLPASLHVSLTRLKEATGADNAEIASEQEFGELFPDCEVGAMPPFGNLYDMPVFAAEQLIEDEEIAFSAGSHTELVQLAYRDFDKLVHPKVIALS